MKIKQKFDHAFKAIKQSKIRKLTVNQKKQTACTELWLMINVNKNFRR